MGLESAYSKDAYDVPLKLDEKPPEGLTLDNYLTFACRHKFCREICPVYQVTRNESHIPYGFNTAMLAVAKGVGKFEELGDQFTHCLQCGACEVRCPNTLFMGDFYRVTLTTIELVRKVRSDLVRNGVGYPRHEQVLEEIDAHLGAISKREDMMKWVQDVGVQIGGESDIALYVSRFTATQVTETARATAKLLKAAGISFSVVDVPSAGIGEPLDVAKEDLFLELSKSDLAKLGAMKASVVIVVDPHDYFFFKKDYVRIFGDLPFEVIFVTDFLWDLVQKGKLSLRNAIKKKMTFHDPCTLNKLTNLWESPRKLLSAIPGIEFIDEDHIDQWYYCCGNGVSTAFKKANPDISFMIGDRRIKAALDLGADTLALGCPHCWDHFSEVKSKTRVQIELANVVELVAQSVGV